VEVGDHQEAEEDSVVDHQVAQEDHPAEAEEEVDHQEVDHQEVVPVLVWDKQWEGRNL